MNLKIHTRGWVGSRQKTEGEESQAMLGVVIEIDGHVIEEVTSARVLARHGDIVTVMVRLIPGELDVIAHTEETWKELFDRP